MPLITVFTPTYNRAQLLPRLYESLCQQTCMDFEWLIVDDGSTDGTEELVKSKFISNNSKFPIRYYWKENGGKHTAINYGVKEAKGELFFIADSDDLLPPYSIEKVAKYYNTIKGDVSFAGICGLDATFDGKIIGSGLPKKIIDGLSLYVRYYLGVKGDMKEVFRTNVLREFPFPEIKGELFCSEVLVWNRIGAKYKLRYFNDVIYMAEYQTDGISSNIISVRMNSPIASMMTYQELTGYDVPFPARLKAAINYWRFAFCRKGCLYAPHVEKKWIWAKPLGLLMHLIDKLRIGK